MERLFEQFKMYLLTERRVSTNTLQSYATDIQQFISFFNEHGHGTHATVDDLKKFLLHLKNMNLSSHSMARKVSSLKVFFSYLERYHTMENCAEQLITPKLEQRLPRCLSLQEVEALLKAANQDTSLIGMRNRLMVNMLYVTGMRVSELVSVHMNNINVDAKLITISGKGGKERVIPATQALIQDIAHYTELLTELAQSKGYRGNPDCLFCVLYAGTFKPMTRQACWIILKKIWALTGIQKTISPHMLRHSLASHMLASGADLRSLQMLLGHEKLSTVQIYTHVDTTYLRTVYDSKHPRS